MHYWSHGLGHAGVGGWMAVLVGGRMGGRVSESHACWGLIEKCELFLCLHILYFKNDMKITVEGRIIGVFSSHLRE